jgi:hypothetical protein
MFELLSNINIRLSHDVGVSMAVVVDAFHALAMVLWLVGLPLLVWHRWPKLTRAYAIYALSFVVIYQVSRLTLGECFLTTIARSLWYSQAPGSAPPDVNEWFTVRLANAIFSATPSHRGIIWVSQVLSVATALGALFVVHRHRVAERTRQTSSSSRSSRSSRSHSRMPLRS